MRVGDVLGASVVLVGALLGAPVKLEGALLGEMVGPVVGADVGEEVGPVHLPQAMGHLVFVVSLEQTRSSSAGSSFLRKRSAPHTGSSSFSKHAVGEPVGVLVVGRAEGDRDGITVGAKVEQ
jgi:hypothetical protein